MFTRAFANQQQLAFFPRFIVSFFFVLLFFLAKRQQCLWKFLGFPSPPIFKLILLTSIPLKKKRVFPPQKMPHERTDNPSATTVSLLPHPLPLFPNFPKPPKTCCSTHRGFLPLPPNCLLLLNSFLLLLFSGHRVQSPLSRQIAPSSSSSSSFFFSFPFFSAAVGFASGQQQRDR